MPSKDTIHFALEPNSREALEADLYAVFKWGIVNGVDFMTRPGGLRGARRPAPKISVSRIVTKAIQCGAAYCRSTPVKVTPRLTSKAGTTGARRLKRARGKMSQQQCAEAAGLKDESSVRNVEGRGFALGGRLLAWVESIEAER